MAVDFESDLSCEIEEAASAGASEHSWRCAAATTAKVLSVFWRTSQ